MGISCENFYARPCDHILKLFEDWPEDIFITRLDCLDLIFDRHEFYEPCKRR